MKIKKEIKENSDASLDYDETKNPFYKDIQQGMMKSSQNNIGSRNIITADEEEKIEIDDYDKSKNLFYEDMLKEIAMKSPLIISNDSSSSNITNIAHNENGSTELN